MNYNVGLKIFHSTSNNINYFLYRKEFPDYTETMLAQVGKNGRRIKSIGSKVAVKTQYYGEGVSYKEKIIKKLGNFLPHEFKIFHNNKDGQTYLLIKDRIGQSAFFKKNGENQYEFVSSKRFISKGTLIEKQYSDGSVSVIPKLNSYNNQFKFTTKKSVISGIVDTKHFKLQELTDIQGNLESLRQRFANNYHLKKILNSVKNKPVSKDSLISVLRFLIKL